MIQTKKRRGFTLIELLVVISIIGLLASITFAFLNNARSRTRDTLLFSNVKKLQEAIEIYKIDHNNLVPVSGGHVTTNPTLNDFSNSCDGTLQASLQPLVDSGILKTIASTNFSCFFYTDDITLGNPRRCGGGGVRLQYLFLFQTENTIFNLPKWYDVQYCVMGPKI